MGNRYEWSRTLMKIMGAEAYERLCNCASLKEDIPLLAKCYKEYRNIDTDSALVTAIEHINENSQLFDYTVDDWDEWFKQVENFK